MEVEIVILINMKVKISNSCGNDINGVGNNSDVGIDNNSGDSSNDDRNCKDKVCPWIKIDNDNNNYYNL